METTNLIAIETFCSSHKIESSFIYEIQEIGLIELTTKENISFIREEQISDLEKIVRFHKDLRINQEGIDVIFQLLNRINRLQEEVLFLKNKLTVYEK